VVLVGKNQLNKHFVPQQHVEHGEEMGGACGAWRRNGWGMWSMEKK
jgi:hypothetical protein